MSPKQPIQSQNRSKVVEQCWSKTPESIIDLIVQQLDRVDESNCRILEEGIVVRNMSGGVIEHPCVKTEIAATKLAADLLTKYKKPLNE